MLSDIFLLLDCMPAYMQKACIHIMNEDLKAILDTKRVTPYTHHVKIEWDNRHK